MDRQNNKGYPNNPDQINDNNDYNYDEFANQFKNTTTTFRAASPNGKIITGEYVETEAEVTSYYQILSIALLGGFLVNFLTAKFFAPAINVANPMVLLIIYIISALVGSVVLHRSESIEASILGYALLVIPLGVCITPMVTLVYSSTIVTTAFLGTTIISVGMVILSFLYPNAFLSMGRVLGLSLILSLVASILCGFFAPGALEILDYAVIIIFGFYIGFDVAKARTYPRTPQFAIRAAADLYLDIINIFLRLLSILGRSDRD